MDSVPEHDSFDYSGSVDFQQGRHLSSIRCASTYASFTRNFMCCTDKKPPQVSSIPPTQMNMRPIGRFEPPTLYSIHQVSETIHTHASYITMNTPDEYIEIRSMSQVQFHVLLHPQGTVQKIMDFGIFVALDGQVSRLSHISAAAGYD